MPPFTAAWLEETRQYIAQHGLGALIDLIRDFGPRKRGHPEIDDSERLEAMGRHLAEDKDLRSEKGALTELAKRAITDVTRPGDFTKEGAVAEHAIRRLVRKFEFFCFDLPGRGLDEGKWRRR